MTIFSVLAFLPLLQLLESLNGQVHVRPQLDNDGTSETPVHLFKNNFFTEHLQWLHLTVSGFQPAALLKKGLQQSRFSVNFAKCLRKSFYRTPPDD